LDFVYDADDDGSDRWAVDVQDLGGCDALSDDEDLFTYAGSDSIDSYE
jgi:hypothetical protein